MTDGPFPISVSQQQPASPNVAQLQLQSLTCNAINRHTMAALEGASKYLNNLLLARGLLQDGKPIDFAHAAHGNDNTGNTMTRVINLVHDLVLRRDRESGQNESMAVLIRNLRAAESQHTLEIQHMQDKHVQLQNDAATVQAHERTLCSTLRRLETQVRDLKEQNLKMKSMLDQVKAKCTGDVRKRDVEIEKLKSHIAGLQRGKKKIDRHDSRESQAGQDANSLESTLTKETHAFLAAIVNETSTENVSLRELIGNTIEILKEITASEDEEDKDSDSDSDGVGIPGQYRKSRQKPAGKIVPVDTLSKQVNTVLDRCRLILRDPSFVSIEEVQVRDEEIAKLRAGWERMADRWKEAVTMMSQWKQRMVLEGKATEVEGFSDLSFGRSVAVRPDGQPVLGDDHELSSMFEESRVEEMTCLSESSGDDCAESDLELEPGPAPKRLASSPARRGVKLLRSAQPLAATTGNSRSQHQPRGSFVDETTGAIHVDIENQTVAKGPKSEGAVKLTVPEKLAAVEAEAIAASKERQQDVVRKRKLPLQELNRKSSRRRSTLSPDELAKLMGMR